LKKRTRKPRPGSWVICFLACLFPFTVVLAQLQDPESSAAPGIGASELEARVKRVEDDSDLTAAVKTEALSLYGKAKQTVAELREVKDELESLRQRITSAPAQIEALRESIEAAPAPADIPAKATVDDLNALATKKRAEVNVSRESLRALEKDSADFAQFASSIVELITDRERALRKIRQDLATVRSSDQPPVIREAREAYLTASQALNVTQLELYRARASNHDVLAELNNLKINAARNSLDALESEISDLTAALQRRRERQASKERLEAAAALASATDLPSEIQAIAEHNSLLKAELEELVRRESALDESLQTAVDEFRDLRSNLSSLEDIIATYGSSEAIGRLLIRKLGQLPQVWDHRERTRDQRAELNRITNRRIDIDERLSSVHFDAKVDAIMASIAPGKTESELATLREQAVAFLETERETLVDLDQAYGRFMTRLTAIGALEGQIKNTATETRNFIRKQLIWIPTLTPISLKDFTHTDDALAWLLSPQNWGDAIRNAGLSYINQPVRFGVLTALLIFLYAVRRRARRELPELAVKVRRIRTDAFAHTCKALGYTLAAALTLPMLLLLLSNLLQAEPIPEDASFSLAIGHAMRKLTLVLFLFSLSRWSIRADGIGPRHFRWPAGVCASLHANVTWLAWVVIPLGFVMELAQSQPNVTYMLGIGRPALMLALLAIAVFMWQAFGRSGSFGDYMRDTPDELPARLWVVWFPVAVGIPIVFLAMSGLGYQVAAYEFSTLLFGETVWLLFGLLLIYETLMRWFTLIARKARVEAVLQQRAESRAEHEHEGEERGSVGVEVEVPEVDYRNLGEKARAVIRLVVFLALVLSVGFVWGELLPVLGVLEQVDLPFTKLEMVDGVAHQIPVNLADLLFGILIFAGAMFVAQNLSGILELTLLRWLRLDPGGNYAIVTLFQYLTITIGVIAGFSAIGLQWAKLQWLIAALGVGLGFGLQEIVANFISGIILLFERPVRIGDIVTVGGADGYVSRIRIRATTILTWDRKELIIPNKEFITGQVINWTLSDSVTRITLNVGIAYGSDVSRALELLGEVARDNELVLEDPAPIVTFEEFGDNALMLCMRCHIASMDDRWPATTSLHKAVNEKFAEAGIPIAFPQRDVHLDTTRPLEINLRRTPPPAASS